MRTALACLAALGCGHTDPFATGGPERAAGPFMPGLPVRLTYNPNQDLYPRFVPDLPAVLYSYETSDAERRDRCLGLMAPTGGVRFQEVCPVSAGSRDSLDAYGPAAVSPEGRIAFVASATFGPRVNPDRSALVVARLDSPLDTTAVHPLPFTIAGIKVDGVTDLRWIDEGHLIYVAQRVDYPRPCSGCKPDTARTGIGIVIADLSTTSPSFALAGGPRNTTSLALDATGAVLYTLGGDARVYRESPPGSAATVVFDFGSDGNARKIDVVGDLLAAVVGGKDRFFIDPVLGPIEWDSGGIIHVVDLASRTTLFRSSPATTFPPPVPADNFFSRPILVSPNQVIVEGLPFAVTAIPTGGVDTALSGPADLWLIRFRP